MKYTRYHIRLYYYHDLDIISYMINYNFDVIAAMYCTLNAFVNDELFVIETPKKLREEPLEKRRVYNRYLNLDPIKDKKAIDFLNKLVKGKQNLFLKNLLRQYLCSPATIMYLKDPQDNIFLQKKFQLFDANKRIVEEAAFEFKRKKNIKKRNNLEKKQEEKIKSNYKTDINNDVNSTPNNSFIKEKALEKNDINLEHIETQAITMQEDSKSNSDIDEITLAFSNLIS